MKRLILFSLMTCLLGVPLLAAAQQPPSFDPSQMQEMMKRFQDPAAMQKMQEQAEAARQCMEDIDQAKLDALQVKAEAAGKEIETLCKAGKKDAALKKGLALSRELQSDATVKQLRECSKEITDMMKDMPWAQMGDTKALEASKEPTSMDICS